MSLRDEKIKSLLGTNLDDLSEEELKKLCNKILASKIHGICFSLYEGTQQPGDIVSDDQIMRRLEILKPYTSSIRTFSSLDEHACSSKEENVLIDDVYGFNISKRLMI